MVSGGHHDWFPLTLVVINVAACGVVASPADFWPRSAGRHALWGLAFAGYWGYLWTLGRDLTELTAAAFVLLGVATFVRRAPIWSGLAFLCAVLSKETSALLVASLALVALWQRFAARPCSGDRRGRRGRRNPAPVGPPAVRRRVRHSPPGVRGLAMRPVAGPRAGCRTHKSGGENLGIPLVGLFSGFSHYLSLFPSTASDFWMAEFGVLILVTDRGGTLVRTRLESSPAPCGWRPCSLALSTAKGIWLGDVGFRSLDDLYLTGWLLLLLADGAPSRPGRSSARARGWLSSSSWSVSCNHAGRHVRRAALRQPEAGSEEFGKARVA